MDIVTVTIPPVSYGEWRNIEEQLKGQITYPSSHKCRSNIERVVFNGPATIIFWKTGEKTIVKCQEGDIPDKEKGFVMAYLKHELGNDNQFNYEIKRWVTDD